MTYPLYVAFVWHMHQPYYKDVLTGEYALPWTRLHGSKDYLHMPQVLADFPRIHATFNLVPSLVEQLLEYAAGRARDRWLELSLKEAWTREEREFLLTYFFTIDWEKVIRRYPRYGQLLERRNRTQGNPDAFTESDLRDLAAWFNLVWIDPNWLEGDETLRALVEKGEGFTRADIQTIAAKQQEIIEQTLPLYRQLQSRGQIELTTSPYYHPILPLLVDTNSAREASPDLPLPHPPFAHPEDAAEQIRRAIAFHREQFGHDPQGMWPPEGAVGQEMLPLVPDSIRWLASDEGVLARSLGIQIQRDEHGHVLNPEVLYQPYQLATSSAQQAIIFRDRVLSDRIGFVYKGWAGREAAEDLVGRLRRIREKLADEEGPYLVSIILDGENCWDGYEHNGDVFLRHLYALLSDDPTLRTVTVSEYLAEHPPRQAIDRLFTGSWINHHLETWIGEEAQNRAWEILARVRETLVAWQREHSLADPSLLERAWRAITIAEGSDWFWWQCSHNRSEQTPLFDALFRAHLGNVYRLLGLPLPTWLEVPISASSQPSSMWVVPAATGAMQRGETIIRRLSHGYDPANLYLRLETREPLTSTFVGVYLAVPGAQPTNASPRYTGPDPQGDPWDLGLAWEVALEPGEKAQLSRADGQGGWQAVASVDRVALGEGVLELALPLHELGLRPGDVVGLLVILARDGVLVEALPSAGCHRFELKAFDSSEER
ncbi:MAG TPA: glycoside hydrolase [Anaerolineae bacterium]|nr:glycoside hydrolase [Anaerolineae bacterium]